MLTLKYKIIQACTKTIPDNLVENLGQVVNLKLHDIISNETNEKNICNYFTSFCDDTYIEYTDKLEQQFLEESHIGFSSDFYLTEELNDYLFNIYTYAEYNSNSNFHKKIMLIEEYVADQYNFDFSDKCCIGVEVFMNHISDVDENIYDYFDNVHDDKEIIDWIKKDIICTIIPVLININNMYGYIDDFKKNQINKWNEYIKMYS